MPDMKIINIRALEVSEIKIIRFARFMDHRGYFTEIFRKSDLATFHEASFLSEINFVQGNESRSRAGTVRGLHLQWNPYMGKLIRTLSGRMIDLSVDIRVGSATFGRIVCFDMASGGDRDFDEWIWVPPGFAHGNAFPEETTIEYLCSGEHNPHCEVSISPLATDIDWTTCDAGLRDELVELLLNKPVMSQRDRAGLSMAAWKSDPRSNYFKYRSD